MTPLNWSTNELWGRVRQAIAGSSRAVSHEDIDGDTAADNVVQLMRPTGWTTVQVGVLCDRCGYQGGVLAPPYCGEELCLAEVVPVYAWARTSADVWP